MLPDNLKASFLDTLLAGRYNLLFGSGTSLDSCNGEGTPLPGTEALRIRLCELTGAKVGTSLTRAYALLTPEQRDQEILRRFSNCQPGPSLLHLPHYLWRRAFTFNVDDVLEELYSHGSPMQRLISLNYDDLLEPESRTEELCAVHLHGFVRRPQSGLVFSTSEYARNMSGNNPWMHILTQILATDSFIIAGTSLNEVDLEYYLSFRSQVTPRRDRGPSILIEPDPDVATRADCERFGLTLVQASIREFLEWLRREIPSPPTVLQILAPAAPSAYSALSSRDQLLLFNDFEQVNGRDEPLPHAPSPFLYGREPSWTDIWQHLDIERAVTASLLERVAGGDPTSQCSRLFLLVDEAGTGKSTVLRRIAHSLACRGHLVLSLRTLARIDSRNARSCFSRLNQSVVLIIDNFADHVEQVSDILSDKSFSITILGADRTYREKHLEIFLSEVPTQVVRLPPLSPSELGQLLERYRQFGLVADERALRAPAEFARRLAGEPVTVAVCRILNDFQPLDTIISSLWSATEPGLRSIYLAASICQHCYSSGARYSILQKLAGPKISVALLCASTAPLRLAENVNASDYLSPVNATVGERVLHSIARREYDLLFSTMVALALALSPYVNRRAIKSRSPESRLAVRLFDADKVTIPLLGAPGAERFYFDVKKEWEWNSRYWEQRALLASRTNLYEAVQFARHAVTIEDHPFPLTTLGKILFMRMEKEPAERDRCFSEAFDRLSQAIEKESEHSRVTIHPFATLLVGAIRFLELGGRIDSRRAGRLKGYAGDASYRFRADAAIERSAAKLLKLMNE